MLHTRNLIIRYFEQDDARQVLPLLMDAEFMAGHPGGALEARAAGLYFREILQYSRIGLGKQALVETDRNQLVGWCGIEPFELAGELKLELSFRIVPRFRGMGYASQAACAVADAHNGELYAQTPADHVGAILVLQRAGFVHVGQSMVDGATRELYLHAARNQN